MGNLETYKMFVNGEWIGSEKSETFESINPSIGKPWALIPEASASDVNKAVVKGPQSDDVSLSTSNNILQIKIPLGSIPDSIPTQIDLYHSKLLNEITVYQGAEVTSLEPIRQTSLKLTSRTGGVMKVEIYAD